LRMVIILSDVASVELTIDSTTVIATQNYVDEKLADHEQSRRHPDGTLTAKGFVQLSSATDSTSETLAATPKAVKSAYDLAKGKYTAQDASTTQKGLVQLTSATDSSSETLAATAKAVKAANDNASGRVPSGRTINGRALSEDIAITAQDIFNGQSVSIGSAADLNAYTVPGLYYQLANSQAANGKNYPEAVAGSLEVYKHAGITQIYRVFNNSRAYIRTEFNGSWSAWAQQYDEANRPAAGEVGAYTKAEGDARYQPKGSYTPAGQAYTKAESDARFQRINSASLGANGWFRDTNTGLLIQYGKVAVSTSGQGVTFPVAFSIVPSLSLNVNSGTYGDTGASSTSTTGFVIVASQRNTVGWMAIGR
ncbi:tail fiber protein, partial [Cronobacter muytjensii]